MAYHIFTLRKLMLTNRMNNLNLQMMNVQFKREDIEDRLLSLWDEYYGIGLNETDTDGKSLEEIREENGVGAANGSSADDDSKKARLKSEITRAQSEENRLDQILKKMETQYSEAQNELKSVESQEAKAIQESVPKYGGVGQQG